MRNSIIATTALFIAGCASTAEIASALRPTDLNAARDQYDGSVVSVYGYMINKPEAHGLWQSKMDYQSTNVDRCVSLLVPSDSYMSGFSEQYVVIRGRFIKQLPESTIHLGACNYPHLEIIGRPVLASAP
jgi:hypothetical protein